MQIMELDYAMQDASGFVQFVDGYGKIHDVPLARWYLGVLADEFSGGICGCYLSYDTNPTADCALQTILSALEPEDYSEEPELLNIVSHKSILVPNLCPAYASQGYALLRVDNGLCNVANDFVNNIVSVIGCAIEFGAPRAWWIRPFIERINGKLAERGVHRLRITSGSGPGDPRRLEPKDQKREYKIADSELRLIIRTAIWEHNCVFTSERFFRSTPLELLERYAALPELNWLPQPLPTQTEKDRRLLMHTVTLTVRGNAQKGQNPYVQHYRERYTNERLARDFTLIGKEVLFQVDRMDPRLAWGVVVETGEDLGKLNGEARWRDWKISLFARKLLNRETMARPADRAPGTLQKSLESRQQKFLTTNPRRRSKKEALTLLKLQQQVTHDPLPVIDKPSGRLTPGLTGPFGSFRNSRGKDDV